MKEPELVAGVGRCDHCKRPLTEDDDFAILDQRGKPPHPLLCEECIEATRTNHFGIDLNVIEHEKRAMIEELRASQGEG